MNLYLFYKMQISITNSIIQEAKVLHEMEKRMWTKIYVNKDKGITVFDIENKFNNTQEKIAHKIEFLESEKAKGMFSIKDQEKLIGFGLGIKHPSKEDNEIITIYLLAQYEKQGIRKNVFHKIVNYLGKQKSIITRLADYDYRSQEFYLSIGFKKSNEKAEFEIIPTKKIPILKFIKSFK